MTRLGGRNPVLLWIVVFVIGIFAGRGIAYLMSLGGTGGALGALAVIVGMIVATMIATVTWVTVTGRRHGDVDKAKNRSLGVVALLAVGTIVGATTAAALGGVVVQPTVLHAGGRTEADVTGGTLSFTAAEPGAAELLLRGGQPDRRNCPGPRARGVPERHAALDGLRGDDRRRPTEHRAADQ